MDYADVSRIVTSLRAELIRLGIEDRYYFGKKHPRKVEILGHQRRVDRIREIKVELERLMTRKNAA